MLVSAESFAGDHPDDIIANISWDLRKPLNEAYLFTDWKNYDEDDEKLMQFNDPQIRQILSNLYIDSDKFVINLWDEHHTPINVQFNFHHNVSYWELLETIDKFLRKGERKYGDWWIQRDTYIKGIYERPDLYSKTKGPYFELDYFD